eukprot:COSAG06_NODE_7458_length_2499_cov_2.047917_1_plen_64_part_00
MHQGSWVPVVVRQPTMQQIMDAELVMEWQVRTMRFLLNGQNRSIFIGNLGLFWICFDRIMGNA